MPLYEYVCNACGHTFEEIVTYEERKGNQECPECELEEGAYQDRIQETVYSQNRSFSRMRLGK